MKHILVVTQYFYPENFRINDMVKEWIKRGYKVTVLTGIPNYPHGRYYDNYGLFNKRKDNYYGADVIRIPIVPRGNNSITLSLNYLSFVLSGYIWNIFNKINADVVFIFEVSPMTQALPAVKYGKKNKVPVLLYVQDLWPENFIHLSGIKNKKVHKQIGNMVDYIYKNTDKIFTTSKSFIESIHQRGVSKEKLYYWPQYSEEFYKPVEAKMNNDFIDGHKFNLIFTGNIGESQGLDILIDVAQKLEDSKKETNIVFNIVGDGRYKHTLTKKVDDKNLGKYFNFIPSQEAENIPQFLAASDVAFLSLNPDPIFEKTIPAKLQSYMSCAKPILASANGETSNIIKESNSGFCSDAGDANKLYDNLKEIYDMTSENLSEIGRNSYKYAIENFNKQKLMDRMDKHINSWEVN